MMNCEWIPIWVEDILFRLLVGLLEIITIFKEYNTYANIIGYFVDAPLSAHTANAAFSEFCVY